MRASFWSGTTPRSAAPLFIDSNLVVLPSAAMRKSTPFIQSVTKQRALQAAELDLLALPAAGPTKSHNPPVWQRQRPPTLPHSPGRDLDPGPLLPPPGQM